MTESRLRERRIKNCISNPGLSFVVAGLLLHRMKTETESKLKQVNQNYEENAKNRETNSQDKTFRVTNPSQHLA